MHVRARRLRRMATSASKRVSSPSKCCGSEVVIVRRSAEPTAGAASLMNVEMDVRDLTVDRGRDKRDHAWRSAVTAVAATLFLFTTSRQLISSIPAPVCIQTSLCVISWKSYESSLSRPHPAVHRADARRAFDPIHCGIAFAHVERVQPCTIPSGRRRKPGGLQRTLSAGCWRGTFLPPARVLKPCSSVGPSQAILSVSTLHHGTHPGTPYKMGGGRVLTGLPPLPALPEGAH